jgi:UDP-2,3-diacylglucosamine pyrophosphatase LpxH
VICGHIHTPEIKEIQGVTYMNSGDWVESCTALVETVEGEWKIVYWTEVKYNVDHGTASDTREESR